MKKIIAICLGLIAFTGYSQQKLKTENVVLITLDGMRWQEIFGGAESRLISKANTRDSATTVKEFWADTDLKRREKLMPFFWNTIANHGQIYGNRKYSNFMNVTNHMWFSYPGYSELLCGFPDDKRIKSNDKFDNPNKTVLEFINGQKNFEGRVAAYTSWDVFPFIINAKRSGLPVNGGIVEAVSPNEKEKVLNELMHEVPNPLGDVRLDAFTFHYAFEYMKRMKPKMLFLSFDETDDFAHGGRYDLYLHSANYTDTFIKTLWEWCQSDTQYKDKTTFIITCDHGRGHEGKDDWHDHGAKVVGADEIWMAVIGPDTSAKGELRTAGQLYQNQIAKTIATLLGLNYTNDEKVGEVIGAVVK